jgi:imidazoleglycerol phosphate synthase glutamine amidotransferase subunit HisH
MKVAIVKYNAGNVESVRNALRRLNGEPIVTDDADTLAPPQGYFPRRPAKRRAR